MRRRRLLLLPSLAALLVAAGCATDGGRTDSRGPTAALSVAYRLPMIRTGISTDDATGRAFVNFSRPGSGGEGACLAEFMPDGTCVPYPNVSWNDYKAGDDPTRKLVGPNSIRFGPDGLLWVVDPGTTGLGTSVVPGGGQGGRVRRPHEHT